jgi:hypothetical protein
VQNGLGWSVTRKRITASAMDASDAIESSRAASNDRVAVSDNAVDVK